MPYPLPERVHRVVSTLDGVFGYSEFLDEQRAGNKLGSGQASALESASTDPGQAIDPTPGAAVRNFLVERSR